MIDIQDLTNTYICEECGCLFYDNEDSYIRKRFCKLHKKEEIKMVYKTSLSKVLSTAATNRVDALNIKIGDITIDTCYANDTDEWETGIETNRWYIVEHYPNKEEAKKGHDKWVEKVNSGIKEFQNCDDIEYGL